MDANILKKAEKWTCAPFDVQTQQEVKELIDYHPEALADAFYKDLEFGTGGLRGVLGVGSNRMNTYTVAMSTQGFACYLKQQCQEEKLQLKVAISYDCRNRSASFALTTAKVFAANGFKVYLFTGMRPTPELSFAVRYFHCCGGVMITASHNPKEYNGYKAYGKDGGQLVAPYDKNVMEEVRKITSVEQVLMQGGEANIIYVDQQVDATYLEKVRSLSLQTQGTPKEKDLKIIYTPLHGTGMTMVPRALKNWGFENVICVPEQMVADGDFSTVDSPNPEEKATMRMAMDLARKEKASLVLATDPDADRVGLAIEDGKGEFVLLNGNQTASLLIYYLINKWKEKGLLTGKEYIIKTIVTTELLRDIAIKNGVQSYDVLTGFKYIADLIEKKQGKEIFIGGGEESYGYLAGDFVRDKDAVISCCLIAEMAVEASVKGKSLMDILIQLYKEYGFYKEDLFSLSKKGRSGNEEINAIMCGFRSNPPHILGGSPVLEIKDYLEGYQNLPPSDVLQFFTEDGSKITVRPSGTEPKIKFYIGVKAAWRENYSLEQQQKELDVKIESLKKDMKIG